MHERFDKIFFEDFRTTVALNIVRTTIENTSDAMLDAHFLRPLFHRCSAVNL